MADAERDTHAKALQINLDPTIYGTIAEIGAGQEVARWFLQAGAASGTVARTISAYDMTFSDAVYGKVHRYVSRDRLQGMLDHEYSLLLERLAASKGQQTRFFAFADTISARNFAGTNECHGWAGVRFQTVPGGPPNDLLVHVNLLDQTNLLQQQAVGILGVNLVFAAFHRREPLAAISSALFEDLAQRIEIDVIAFAGPAFAGADPAAAAIELVQNDMAEAVTLPVAGAVVPPSELLRKRPLVFTPGLFAEPGPAHVAMLAAGRAQLAAEIGPDEREPLPLFVLARRRPGETQGLSTAQLVARAAALRGLGSDVLVAHGPEIYRVVRFALRYTASPVRVVSDAVSVADLLQTRYYRHLDGELMEALAQLFAYNVRLYVHPVPAAALTRVDPATAAWISAPADGGPIALEHLAVPPPTSHLFAYLVDSGFLRAIPPVS
jgi:hypothetical protein